MEYNVLNKNQKKKKRKGWGMKITEVKSRKKHKSEEKEKNVAVLCLVAQSCPTVCNHTDCSPPGSFVHGILQARLLEWVAMPSSRGSSHPRDQTQVSDIAGGFFTS